MIGLDPKQTLSCTSYERLPRHHRWAFVTSCGPQVEEHRGHLWLSLRLKALPSAWEMHVNYRAGQFQVTRALNPWLLRSINSYEIWYTHLGEKPKILTTNKCAIMWKPLLFPAHLNRVSIESSLHRATTVYIFCFSSCSLSLPCKAPKHQILFDK